MWYIFIKTLVAIIFIPLYRLKVVGKENLPKDRGFIIAPNHIFIFDPVFVVLAAAGYKKMVILGKEELFKNSFLRLLFESVGGVPVSRGSGDKTPLIKAVERVKNGTRALVFPEGTRVKTGELGKLKSGAFVIAAQANVDMVPCKIIYKPGKILPIRKCVVIFGQPIPASEFDSNDSKSASNLRRCKQILKQRLEELSE